MERRGATKRFNQRERKTQQLGGLKINRFLLLRCHCCVIEFTKVCRNYEGCSPRILWWKKRNKNTGKACVSLRICHQKVLTTWFSSSPPSHVYLEGVTSKKVLAVYFLLEVVKGESFLCDKVTRGREQKKCSRRSMKKWPLLCAARVHISTESIHHLHFSKRQKEREREVPGGTFLG